MSTQPVAMQLRYLQPLTIQWLVIKAWQHTLEHTHDVLRLHLFWDAAAYLDAHPEELR